MYTDQNYPAEMPDWAKGKGKLRKSPKDLGISRADFWAFTGLVALDEYLAFTKTLCNHTTLEAMCDDTSTPCYTALPKFYTQMFKTGRSDCIPSQNATSNQGYVASKKESHLHHGSNGKRTVEYFDSHFDMSGKEALALMGAHTVGRFNTITSHNDYSWVRDFSERPRVFNNEYYKVLGLKSMKKIGVMRTILHHQIFSISI